MPKKIYLLVTGTSGLPNDPRAFATEAQCDAAYKTYCEEIDAPWDRETQNFDLSYSEEFAARFVLDCETLKVT